MNSNLGVKNIFYILLVTVLLWFLYSQRQILAPFIIAMIFAFVFNPLFPMHLGKEIWVAIDIIVAIIFSVSIFKIKVILDKVKGGTNNE